MPSAACCAGAISHPLLRSHLASPPSVQPRGDAPIEPQGERRIAVTCIAGSSHACGPPVPEHIARGLLRWPSGNRTGGGPAGTSSTRAETNGGDPCGEGEAGSGSQGGRATRRSKTRPAPSSSRGSGGAARCRVCAESAPRRRRQRGAASPPGVPAKCEASLARCSREPDPLADTDTSTTRHPRTPHHPKFTRSTSSLPFWAMFRRYMRKTRA